MGDSDPKDGTAVQVNMNQEEKQGKYPRGAALVLTMEIFRCYTSGANRGMTMLLVDKAGYNQDKATSSFHTLTSLALGFPIITAIVSDSWTGKYPLLLLGCTTTAVGLSIITATSAPFLNLPIVSLLWIGMILRAVGWGMVGPTMQPIGADQFELPRQKKYLAQYFMWDHMLANIFIFTGIHVTAIIRADIHCFGETSCYSLAFLIPSICMFILVFVFAFTKKYFKLYKPARKNVIVSVVCCIFNAIFMKIKNIKHRDDAPKDHWLYYSTDKYDEEFVEEVKSILHIMFILLPTILIWGVYTQFETRWIFQATRLDLRLAGYLFKAEQVIVMSAIMVIVLVPVTEYVFYPFLAKFNIKRPLIRSLLGAFLIAFSFLLAALLELLIEARLPPPLVESNGQFRFYNAMECSYMFRNLPGEKNLEIKSLGYYEDTDIGVKGEEIYEIGYSSGENCSSSNLSGIFQVRIREKISMAYVFKADKPIYHYEDVVNCSNNGYPYLRILSDEGMKDSIVIKDSRYTVLDSDVSSKELRTIYPGKFDVYIGGKKLQSNYELLMGGYYAFLLTKANNTYHFNINLLKEPNYYHMMMQMPQLFFIALGEIFFMLPIKEFVFGETPQSLKTFLWAYNTLMNSFGNLIPVFFAENNLNMSSEFFMYSGILSGVLIIFGYFIWRYKYVNPIWK